MLVRRWLWLSALLSLSISVGGLALANENKGGYRVIEAKGQVRVKSPSGSNYRPLATGGVVRQGDIVYPAEAAKVTVLCEGSRIWQVPPGVPSGVNSGCPVAILARTRRVMTVNLGGQDKNIPYVISPRYSYLRDRTPRFRWNSVPGAKRYTVRLLQKNLGELWQAEVQGTEVTYPDSAPTLQDGVGYLLTVETVGGKSSLTDGGWNLGFKLLDDQEIAKVDREVAALEAAADLSAAAKAIALAEIYRDYYLVAEAIDILQSLINSGNLNDPNQRALVYGHLGELQAEMGLNAQAEQNLLQAVALFRQTENQQGLADAQAGLVPVQWLLGKTAESEQMAQQAKTAYQGLEDEEGLNILEKVLARAKAKNQQQPTPGTTSNTFSLAGKIELPSPIY